MSLNDKVLNRIAKSILKNAASTVEPRVYVGTYGKYNNGSIAGQWFDLSNYDSSEEFYEDIRELHSDEEDPEDARRYADKGTQDRIGD